MTKFAVGEIAVFVGTVNNPYFIDKIKHGDEVEIIAVDVRAGAPLSGPGPDGTRYGWCAPDAQDYEVRHVSGFHCHLFEDQIRKRPQRGIPVEVLRLFEAPITEDATA